MRNSHYLYNSILTAFLVLLLNSCSTISPKNPTLQSDKFRLMWNDDPMTTMTIGWHQYEGKPMLHYGLTKKMESTLTPQRTTHYRGMNNKFARLTKLNPDSKYYFKVCTQNQCTDTMYFKTAPDTNKPFTFIAGGDSRTIPEGRIRGNLLISKIRPLFIAHGGDYTSSGTPKQWYKWLTEWQQTKSNDGRMYPLLITHGNHENDDHLMMNKIFDVPNIDVYSKREFNFLSLYTLNTELEPMVGYSDLKHRYKEWNPQTKWLKETLEKDNKRWKVASYHRPLRPHRSSKQEGKLRYLEWAPLFYNYGVQLSIECDSHLVKYTKPLKPDLFGDEGFIVDKTKGTTYIGEGSWGAPTRVNDDDKSWTIDSGKFWQFKLITAKPNSLEIRTVKFGDEDVPYNPHKVEEITQKQQDENPLVIPKKLDLWQSKIGRVLTLTL
ncbi:MAG TPA: metallophosphoesterase family protein [Campylobacterales bacterium]|nr:metallophosphoesterase family protein [Campylobacterales bacterium]HHS92655.1 metallophosphoesterase family protein [Campylobacterales bacterium]